MAKQIKKMETPDLNQPLTPEFIGQLVKARRTQSSLRLEDAAALCGVAKQTLMKIEHGVSTCQVGSVLQVCSGLGIRIQISPWNTMDEEDNEWR
jgi:transcriptional regulator with XRE-family HTH domain